MYGISRSPYLSRLTRVGMNRTELTSGSRTFSVRGQIPLQGLFAGGSVWAGYLHKEQEVIIVKNGDDKLGQFLALVIGKSQAHLVIPGHSRLSLFQGVGQRDDYFGCLQRR